MNAATLKNLFPITDYYLEQALMRRLCKIYPSLEYPYICIEKAMKIERKTKKLR
jgi:hypothetical protein